jgi:hypothetical protein
VSALVCVLALTVTGCSDGLRSADPLTPSPTDTSAEACAAAVDTIVQATQRYVAGYGTAGTVGAPTTDEAVTPSPSGSATGEAPFTEEEFQNALTSAQATLTEQACGAGKVRSDLEDGLGLVEARGPVAQAVLRQLTASLTGRLERTATTRVVAPGDDLGETLAELPPGSTVELAEGEFLLSEPLVVLSSVTLRGAGVDSTTVISTASDAAILAVTDGRVEIADIAVRREAGKPGSGLLAGPAASVVVTNARFSGGVATKDGNGGSAIVMFAGEDPVSDRGTTLEVTGSDLVDNEAAGVVLTGAHRASVVGSTIGSNGQCGVCFLDASSGSIETTSFTGNGVGVAVAGTASPVLVGGTITGGEVGLQVSDAATPTVSDVTIRGAARAAVIYTGTSGGAIDGVTCRDVPFGIVVGPSVAPTLGNNSCELVASDK